MTVCIDNCFTQSIIRNLKIILSVKTIMRRTRKVEMLEEESHSRIHQLKDIAFMLLVVDEILLAGPFESRKA